MTTRIKKRYYIPVIIILIAEIVFLILYFAKFKNGLSDKTDNWMLFSNILNGLAIVVLTTVNILIFYKISMNIEKNTHNRSMNDKMFEAQKIITQIRIDKYNVIRELIYDVRNNNFPKDKMELLKNTLANEITGTYFFVNDKRLQYFEPFIESFISAFNLFESDRENKDYWEKLFEQTNNILNALEITIIGQLVRDNDLEKYMNNNKGNMDSTITAIDDLLIEYINEVKNKNTTQPQ